MHRLIHHTFAPLATKAYTVQTLSVLLQPWTWKNGTGVQQLEKALKERFGAEAFCFSSGRECLLAILRSLHYRKDEEVLVQGYTCVVVPDAVIAAGMKPVYCDIDSDTLSLDPDELEKHITPLTRAVVLQHTFGIPAYLKRIRDTCDRHGLLLIEDCAHMLPDKDGPSDICQIGDMSFCSFGRDKAISGIAGGAVLCKKEELCEEIRSLQESAKPLPLLTIKRLLLYPLIYGISRPLYTVGIGKALLKLSSMLRILPRITSEEEKNGNMDKTLHAMPNACALLALQQLQQLEKINNHRRTLTRFYFEELSKQNITFLLGVTPDLPLQKFPLLTKRSQRIRKKLKKKNILLDDGWAGCTICPPDTNKVSVLYNDDSTKKAETVGQQILNLPTHPLMSKNKAKKLLKELVPLLKEKESL